ncbi:MinD/ParA family ATP-binding protein [Gulosibacter molinativorax]|uniref:Chromosome partitioning protein n=1 Tax=Gulosibacter molinativorax TaxID=256821 RepID=A0ABT7C433_9MICO|nr:hypothetical protein [Gulosibacter molinativorax]MDJ1369992.1 hypothetical protein [Gulosibacter molinativorax]QUY63818.1 ESX-1 secretion-associated protein EspI [Gulosibacter molinativorax]
MAQEMSQTGRSLVALVRADGHGELRDGDRVIRMNAGNSDELRGQLMERAIAIAVDEGREIDLKTIDVDGIYSLVCYPNGNLEQVGDVQPLGPGDIELTPEADSNAADGGYAQLFGSGGNDGERDADSVHETIQLPREGMLAKQLEVEEREQAAAAAAAADDDDEDLEEEFHDEGLDHDFDDVDEDPQQVDSATANGTQDAQDEGGASVAQPDAGVASRAPEPKVTETPTSGEDFVAAAMRDPYEVEPGEPEAEDDWRPAFTRGDARRSEPLTKNDDEDLLAASEKQRGRKIAPQPAASTSNVPTLDDFLSSKQSSQNQLAESGWRARVRRASGGLIKLGPGKQERTIREEMDQIQKSFDGTRTIVVVNPKGGAHKTTATLMIAAAFGTMRGGYTLAWDNNETRGTLGWRSRAGVTNNTAVDLLRELPHFEISGGATISDIDRYVRNQGNAKFDVLASDDDAASAAIIDDDAFSRLHRVLSRFYRIMVIDTGNNMRASNWEAALNIADQLVIVSTAREDTAASAAWLADGLRERGYGQLLADAVTILSSPSAKEDPELTEKLHSHFTQLTRAVVSVPYDQEFVGGGELNIPNLQPATRDAWRHAAAVIAQGL